MGLTRKITISSISKNGKSITFKETTGSYLSSNVGGFGTPNPAAADTVKAYLLVQRYDESIQLIGGKTNPTDIAAILGGTDFVLTTSALSKTNDIAFPDGVLAVTSFMLLPGVLATGSLKELSGVDLSPLLSADSIAVVDSNGMPSFYRINKSAVNTSTNIYLLSCLLDEPFTVVYPVYEATDYILNTKTGEAEHVAMIGSYAEGNDCCDKTRTALIDLYFQKIAAEVKFAKKSYTAADELAATLLNRIKLLTQCY